MRSTLAPAASKLALLGGTPVGKVTYPKFPTFTEKAIARAADMLRDGLPQFRQALSGTVVRPALVERLLGRLNYVRRRGEIRFADFRVNDATALCFQRLGPDQHIEGGLHPDAAHALCQIHNRAFRQ